MRGQVPAALAVMMIVTTMAAEGTVIAAAGPIDQSTSSATSPSAAQISESRLASPAGEPLSSAATRPTPRQSEEVVLLLLAPIALVLILWRSWWRIDRPPGHPRLSPMVAMTLYLAIFLLGRIGVMLGMRAIGVASTVTSVEFAALSLKQQSQLLIGAYGAQLVGLIVFAAFVVMHSTKPDRADGRRWPRLKSILLAPAALLVGYPIVNAVGTIAASIETAIRGSPVNVIAHDTLRLLVDTPINGWWLTMAGLVIIAAPVVEEVMYRSLVQGTLVNMRVRRWPAIALTSAFFAIMHAGVAQPNALAALLVLSILFGWAYERSGRLITSILMHALFNAANLMMAMASQ